MAGLLVGLGSLSLADGPTTERSGGRQISHYAFLVGLPCVVPCSTAAASVCWLVLGY